jgi:hypothetical protein
VILLAVSWFSIETVETQTATVAGERQTESCGRETNIEGCRQVMGLYRAEARLARMQSGVLAAAPRSTIGFVVDTVCLCASSLEAQHD